MNGYEVANILYNMAIDMDTVNELEYADEEIELFSAELEYMSDDFFNCLERIARSNLKLMNWHKKLMVEHYDY